MKNITNKYLLSQNGIDFYGADDKDGNSTHVRGLTEAEMIGESWSSYEIFDDIDKCVREGFSRLRRVITLDHRWRTF